MTVETEQFQLEDIVWSFTESRAILGDRNPRRPIKTGIKSIRVTCKSCNKTWQARTYGEGRLLPLIGNVKLICPYCNEEETIKNTDLE